MVKKTDRSIFKGEEERIVSYPTKEGRVKVIHISSKKPIHESQDSMRHHVLETYLGNEKDSYSLDQQEWDSMVEHGLYDKLCEMEKDKAPYEDISMMIQALFGEIPDRVSVAFGELD